MPNRTARRPRADNETRSLASILQDTSITAPKALVPGVIVEKSATLFYAREKAGKTTLLLFMMKQLAMGLAIFGQRSRRQTVLLVSLEEPVHLIKLRAKSMSIPRTADVHVLRSVMHSEKPPLQVLEEAIVKTGATVVIIDTLSAYVVGQISGENASAGWGAVLYPLMQLPSKHDFALVIAHHANKDGLDFRGSTAIGAAPDTIVSLTTPKGAPDNVRLLRYKGRYGSGELHVARDAETGDYQTIDSSGIVPDRPRGSATDTEVAKRILEARGIGGGATKEALRKAGGVKALRADAAIAKLLLEGRLVKQQVKGGFRYAAA